MAPPGPPPRREHQLRADRPPVQGERLVQVQALAEVLPLGVKRVQLGGAGPVLLPLVLPAGGAKGRRGQPRGRQLPARGRGAPPRTARSRARRCFFHKAGEINLPMCDAGRDLKAHAENEARRTQRSHPGARVTVGLGLRCPPPPGREGARCRPGTHRPARAGASRPGGHLARPRGRLYVTGRRKAESPAAGPRPGPGPLRPARSPRGDETTLPAACREKRRY